MLLFWFIYDGASKYKTINTAMKPMYINRNWNKSVITTDLKPPLDVYSSANMLMRIDDNRKSIPRKWLVICDSINTYGAGDDINRIIIEDFLDKKSIYYSLDSHI